MRGGGAGLGVAGGEREDGGRVGERGAAEADVTGLDAGDGQAESVAVLAARFQRQRAAEVRGGVTAAHRRRLGQQGSGSGNKATAGGTRRVCGAGGRAPVRAGAGLRVQLPRAGRVRVTFSRRRRCVLRPPRRQQRCGQQRGGAAAARRRHAGGACRRGVQVMGSADGSSAEGAAEGAAEGSGRAAAGWWRCLA